MALPLSFGPITRAIARALTRVARRPALRARTADGLLRLALGVEPEMGEAGPAWVAARLARGDRVGALEAALATMRRFPRSSAAWLLLGETYQSAFRPRQALEAFEQSLALEERADVAMRAGMLYRREAQHRDAAARFARAYAAGAGPEALYENACSLWAAGDVDQALQALELWGTHFADGAARVREARSELERRFAAAGE